MIQTLHQRRRSQRGFTLVELFIVISLMTIMAGLVIPSFMPDLTQRLESGADVVAVVTQENLHGECSLTTRPIAARRLVGRIRQQRDVARALDGYGEHALVLGGIAGDAARDDLAALGHVMLEHRSIHSAKR